MVELLRYDKVLRDYKASGYLQLSENQTFQCSFDAVQFVDSAIRVQCSFPGRNASESATLMRTIGSGVSVQSVYGITQDNQKIALIGQIQATMCRNCDFVKTS